MQGSTFFKLFPPPQFLLMNHAGLDISDDAIHCIEYHLSHEGRKIKKYASQDLPPGLIDGGTCKDELDLQKRLAAFDSTQGLSYAKVSLPEEKVYLFQTEVPTTDAVAVEQNIEFKLEENVPLSARDAVFYFELLPAALTDGKVRASVCVAPRAYVEHYTQILRGAGISPIAFEVSSKAIARAIIPAGNTETVLIVNIMKRKTGFYVVVGGVVCFSSTITTGPTSPGVTADSYKTTVATEINRVHEYWQSHANFNSKTNRIILVGHDAPAYEAALQNVIPGTQIPTELAHVWTNVFDSEKTPPPISREDSFEYAVSAGLALNV